MCLWLRDIEYSSHKKWLSSLSSTTHYNDSPVWPETGGIVTGHTLRAPKTLSWRVLQTYKNNRSCRFANILIPILQFSIKCKGGGFWEHNMVISSRNYSLTSTRLSWVCYIHLKQQETFLWLFIAASGSGAPTLADVQIFYLECMCQGIRAEITDTQSAKQPPARIKIKK